MSLDGMRKQPGVGGVRELYNFKMPSAKYELNEKVAPRVYGLS